MNSQRLKSILVRHPLGVAAVFGVLLAILAIAEAFVNGRTFGQRCAVTHERGSAAWETCVHKLAQNGSGSTP